MREGQTLSTARLVLAPCTPADCADFISLERDPEVMRYLNGGLAVERNPNAPDPGFLMPTGTEEHVWTARRLSDSSFVGWFCLWPDSATIAELGYRLARTAWGQGLATEAITALTRWGFEQAGYETIFASTMTINHASRRVLEKAGFAFARMADVTWAAPFPGTEQGEVVYEAKRASWTGAGIAITKI